MKSSGNSQEFTKERWEKETITTITMLRLPFRTIEHPQFRKLLQLAQSAPSLPDFPSAKTIQRRLFTAVEERHHDILQLLPSGAKMSIALDC